MPDIQLDNNKSKNKIAVRVTLVLTAIVMVAFIWGVIQLVLSLTGITYSKFVVLEVSNLVPSSRGLTNKGRLAVPPKNSILFNMMDSQQVCNSNNNVFISPKVLYENENTVRVKNIAHKKGVSWGCDMPNPIYGFFPIPVDWFKNNQEKTVILEVDGVDNVMKVKIVESGTTLDYVGSPGFTKVKVTKVNAPKVLLQRLPNYIWDNIENRGGNDVAIFELQEPLENFPY